MSLLKGAGVGKYFGAEDVFQNLDFSIEKAKRELGYEPAVTIDEGLKRLQAYLQPPA